MGWRKEDDWFWEGNVQRILEEFFRASGFEVIATDAIKKQQGPDMLVSDGSRKILIEIKGWPAAKIADGPRQGQEKKAASALQASHWFAGCLSTIIRRRKKFPDHELAIAFPMFNRYVSLLEESKWAIELLGIQVYLIKETKEVYKYL
ncbi:MAG: hypothetical protein EPO32_10175 [Anaerolineae bacterium]|nr:MAG: hypothetical protein EPO32_10175 [Anaerolineae bacterium]